MTALKAIDLQLAPNLRRMRASMFAAMAMKALDELLPHDSHREAYDALYALFHDNGFDAITDDDRMNAGLDQRGERGLTSTELQIMEHQRTLAMLQPFNIAFETTKSPASPFEDTGQTV